MIGIKLGNSLSPLFQLAKRLLPENWKSSFLLFAIILLQIANYVWRYNKDEFIMDQGLGLLFTLIALAPFLLWLLIVVGVLIVLTIHYAFIENGRVLPLAVLIIGSLISQFLPLPPSSAELAFYIHSAEYERVVDLARQNQLGHEENCGYMFSIPTEYKNLTKECVEIVYDPALAMLFSPPNSHRDIAYAEIPEALHKIDTCNGEFGSLFKKLNEHWYICTPAQD
jgi:hypothetical protein